MTVIPCLSSSGIARFVACSAQLLWHDLGIAFKLPEYPNSKRKHDT